MSAAPVSTAGSAVGNVSGNPIAETPRTSPTSSPSSIIGIVTPKGDSDHSRLQLLNDKKVKNTNNNSHAVEAQKVASLESVRPAGRSLKKGTFLCDGDVLKNFIYVPSGYIAHTDHAVECILRELGVPLPEIAFRFDKTFNVAPPLEDEEEERYIEALRQEQFKKRLAEGKIGRKKGGRKNASSRGNSKARNNEGNLENCRSKLRSFYSSEGFEHRNAQAGDNNSDEDGSQSENENDNDNTANGQNNANADPNSVSSSDKENGNNKRENSKANLDEDINDIVLSPGHPLPNHLKDPEYEKELKAFTAYSGRPPLDCEHTRIIEHRVKTVVEGISSACAQTSAVYLIREAFRGNKLAEIACQSLKPGVTALSITPARWLTFLCEEKGSMKKLLRNSITLSPGVWIKGAVRDQGGMRRYLENSDCDPPKPWDEACDDHGVIASHTVGLGEEVRSVINISCQFTADEKNLMAKERRYMVSGGLIPECTHNLIFQSVRDYEEFSSGFSDKFPTGIIVAGGLGRPWDAAMHAMKEGTPLFVLKGTADAAQILADLIELYDRRQIKDVTNPLAIPKLEELCWSSREQIEMMIRDEHLRSDGKSGANTTQPHGSHSAVADFCEQRLRRFIDTRFPKDESKKSVFSGQKDFLRKKARVVAQDFPEHFNREAAMDEITKVMASVYNTSHEMGGKGAEIRSVLHAQRLRAVLEKAAYRYRRWATMMMGITRVFVISAVILTILQSFLSYEDMITADQQKFLMYCNVILPLCIGVMTSLYATYRPMPKFAATLAASKRIEAEEWRFRMRTGNYRAQRITRAGLKTHRERFADAVSQIWSECAMSDAANGSVFVSSMPASIMFSQRDGEEIGSKFNSIGGSGGGGYGSSYGSKYLTNSSHYSNGQVEIITGTKPLTDTAQSRKSAATGFSRTLDNGVDNGAAVHPVRFSDNGADNINNHNAKPKKTSNLKHQSKISKSKLSALTASRLDSQISDKERTRVLSPEEYIDQRLLLALAENQAEVRHNTKKLQALQFLMVLITAVSSGLAAFGAQLWVPIALSFTALLEFLIAYQQLESRIPATNATIGTLTSLLCYWDGLSLIARRMPRNKELLVNTTEDALLLKHEAFVQAAVKLDAKNESSPNIIIRD